MPKKKSPEPTPRGPSTKVLYLSLGVVLILILGAVGALYLLAKQANNVEPSKTITRVHPTLRPPQPGFATDIAGEVPGIRATDIVFGKKDAPVVLYEYADLECPFCKTYQPTLNLLEGMYPDDLAVVYRHYPLSIHPNAPMEAEVLACVSAESKDMARALIILNYQKTVATGTSFTLDQFLDLAKEVGANRDKTATCYQNGEQKAVVAQDIADAHTLAVNLTPTTFLVRKSDGRSLQIKGAYGLTDLQTAIQYILP